jgi:pimeloyl-ACP methyl ester carboxylesterase
MDLATRETGLAEVSPGSPPCRSPKTITGGRDIPYNQAIRNEALSRLSGARDVFLPDASHMANMEQPQIVSEAIASFANVTPV